MKAQDDFTIKRDIKLGFLIFMLSEKLRHQDDIAFIDNIVDKMYKEENITDDEWHSMTVMAERYRKF